MNNKKLYEKLERKVRPSKKKVILYKFVNNIDELMEIATVIITKAGGLTTAEALAKGLPMVIIRPLPGQEEINTTYFLNKGVAVKIIDDKLIPVFIQELLSNPSMLKGMREAALRMSRPQASLDIAKLALEQAEAYVSWRLSAPASL